MSRGLLSPVKQLAVALPVAVAADIETASVKPSKPLKASELALLALMDGVQMRSAVKQLQLQGLGLLTVSRAEFRPKFSVSTGMQRGIASEDGRAATATSQAQAALDMNWRLPTGTTVKLSRSLSNDLVASKRAGTTSLSIIQPILKGAGSALAQSGLLAAESSFRIASRELRRTAATLVLQAISAYVVAQQATTSTAQARIALGLAQNVHALNTALVKAGRSPSNVLLQSAADISSSRLAVAQSENAERIALRAMALTAGRTNAFESFNLVLTDDFSSDINPDDIPTPETLVKRALDASTEVFSAREALIQAERQLKQAENDLLPSLGVSVGSTVTDATGSTAARRDSTIGVALEYSFDRAPLALAKASAQAAVDTAKSQVTFIEQQVRDSAMDALRNFKFAQEQLVLTRLSTERSALLLDAEVTRQQLGRSSQLELSNAQQQQSAANRQLREAKTQVFLNRNELEQLQGLLLNRWGVNELVESWITQALKDLQ